MRVNEAIILAGGKGSRLQSVVSDIPKPMAPIDDRPFIAYLLDYLLSFGINHVILSVGYKWQVIQDHFGEQYKSIRLSYAVEKSALGTGGGIKRALEHAKGKDVFILNGDTFFMVNLKDLNEFYHAHRADMAMTVKRMSKFFRYGTVELDVCRVVGFKDKKPLSSGLINGGVYIINRDLFSRFDLPVKFSFETDFLEKYIDKMNVFAMRSAEYFIDIGVPGDYQKAIKELPGFLD